MSKGTTLRFYKTDPDHGIASLAGDIQKALDNQKRVLWLVPGGSNIAYVVKVMKRLKTKTLEYLAIALTDERFGKHDHADSNMRQLTEAGFDARSAFVLPTLQPSNLSLAKTVARYEETIQLLLNNADEIIAQFGIGADGHIAGILPDSLAVQSRKLVCGYKTEHFTRITLTPKALKHINIAYAFVYGASKHETLQKLHDTSLSLSLQPSQILKQLPKSYVYNDHIGELV